MRLAANLPVYDATHNLNEAETCIQEYDVDVAHLKQDLKELQQKLEKMIDLNPIQFQENDFVFGPSAKYSNVTETVDSYDKFYARYISPIQ